MQKNRTICFFNITYKLKFGIIGLFLTQPLFLTGKHIHKFKLFLKKATKKHDKTYRKFWFNGFPSLPLTKKSINSRMGKGKGKTDAWFVKLRPGSFLFELKNLRQGRAFYFLKQMKIRISVPSTIICFSSIRIKSASFNKVCVLPNTFN